MCKYCIIFIAVWLVVCFCGVLYSYRTITKLKKLNKYTKKLSEFSIGEMVFTLDDNEVVTLEVVGFLVDSKNAKVEVWLRDEISHVKKSITQIFKTKESLVKTLILKNK